MKAQMDLYHRFFRPFKTWSHSLSFPQPTYFLSFFYSPILVCYRGPSLMLAYKSERDLLYHFCHTLPRLLERTLKYCIINNGYKYVQILHVIKPCASNCHKALMLLCMLIFSVLTQRLFYYIYSCQIRKQDILSFNKCVIPINRLIYMVLLLVLPT